MSSILRIVSLLAFALLGLGFMPWAAADSSHVEIHFNVDPQSELGRQLPGNAVDPHKYSPELQDILHKMIQKSGALLKEVAGPEDGTKKIHFVLLDSLRPNAHFKELYNGEKIVAINLGLLKLLDNDDELAFVLGHELEHGLSEIEKEANGLSEKGSRRANLQSALLTRTVESEVDLKSVLRLIRNGKRSPHAAWDSIQRLLTRFGDSLSTSHPLLKARADYIASLLAGEARVVGSNAEFRLDDKPRNYSIFGLKEKEALATGELEQVNQAIVENLVKASNVGEWYYKKIKDGEVWAVHGQEGHPRKYNAKYTPFEKEFDKIWNQIEVVIPYEPKSKPYLDLQLQLNENLHHEFEKARDRILGEGFVPKDYEQMEAMVALEKRGYRVDAPDLGRSYRALKDTQKKIAAVKKKLEKATTDSDRETAESQIRSLEVEENQIKHKYETAKSLFENSSDEIDSILEKDRNFEKISYGSTIDEDNYVEKIKGVGLKIRRIQGLLEDLGDAFKGREQYYRKLYSDRYNSGKEFQTLGELSNAILEMDRKEATLEKLGDSFDRILRSELKKNAGSYSIEESLSTAAQIVKYLAHFSKEKSNRYAEWCKLLIEAADDQNTLTTAGQALGPALSRGDSKSYQEVVQLFRNRLSETIRRKLMGAPQSSLSSLLQRLRDLRQSYKEVTRYLDKSLNAGETLLDPELLTSISEELSKNAESLGIRGVTLEQMKSLVLSSFPELGPSPLNWKSLQGILADLRSLGDNKSLTRQESSLVDVKLLEELVIYDRWRWQEHAETSESASPEYAVKEAIQEQDLVFRTKHRLRSTQARRTLDRVEKSRQEAFYQTFVATRKIQVPNKEEYFLDSELTKILIRRLSKDRPEDLSTLKALIQENSILSEKEFNQFLSQYFRRLLKKYPSVDEATFQFWKNLDEAGFAPGHQQMYGLSEAIESWIPSGKIRAGIPDLGFYNAYRKGVRKFAEHIREHGAKARYENSLDIERAGEIEFEIGRRLGSNKIVNLFETDRYRFHSPDAIAETFLESLRDDPKFFPRARWDQVFDYLLSFRDSHPKIRERLLDPALVSKVFFVTTKERLAKWQLSNIRGFNEFLDDYKAKRAPLPKEGEVRPIVREVYKLIAKQFPDRSPSGVGVLQYVEKQLLPNEAETHLLADLRINASNWSKTRGIEYADAPQALAGMITSDPERLKLIKFFIGVTDEPPSIAGIYPDRLLFGRRSFQENGPVFRALTLQSLLDTQTGFLESPESRKELKKVIFGSAIEDPAIMTIFEAYLDVLPKSEKKVFVSAILASYGQDRPGRVSLKRVLEAGGPLGGKASQDLVTNAVVDEAGRADLMESFDNVLPPIREEVIGQLKEAFGKNYVMIKGIGRVPGSGSLNYVVEAVIFNPKSKRKETVSVRIQKKNVSNLIEGENSAWVKVWGKLRDHPNPKVRRLMRIIEDRRAAAYKTLNPNGSQLDLKMERDAYELAKRAYQNSDPDPKTGFTVEPVEPKLRLQKLVDKDHQTRVSVYEFVEHTKLADIPDPELRRALAAQIMEAELRAIEHRGVFDEDGHIGNWLIDLKKKRLVRVDYAQLHQIKPEQVQSFKTVLGSLMDASAGAQERLEPLILSQFSHIFETSETPPDLEAVLRSVLREPELQQTLSPFEKLLRIQDRVETHYLDHGIKDLRVTLKEEFRAPLASLVRASMFRESTGNLAYLRRLSTFFGVDANAIAKAHISREVADFVSESRTRATQAAIRTGLSLLDRGRSLGVRSATSLRCGLNGALKRLSTPKGGGSQPDDESK